MPDQVRHDKNTSMSTLLIFLVVIIVLVVAHELGHLFVAKSFGVRVDEFGLGYPPLAKKLFTWKGTLFTLNWLPFGGFVKIFGEDGDGTTVSSNSFSQQKLWKRLLILLAGIVANMLLAVVLYTMSFSIGFLGSSSDFPNAHIVSPEQLMVTEVLKDSPAASAGIKANDKIVSVSINDTVSFVPKSADDFIQFVQTNKNVQMQISILRNNTEQTVSVTPKSNVVNGNPGIGVGIEEITLLRMNFFDALGNGFSYTWDQFKLIIVSLCVLVKGLFMGNGSVASQLSGPVGIAKFAGAAYSLGIGSFFAFMALFSVNLAVVNLLPFPALDGGRMILELFSSKGHNKISSKIVSAINQIGFLLLIILMIWVTYHDIFHPA